MNAVIASGTGYAAAPTAPAPHWHAQESVIQAAEHEHPGVNYRESGVPPFHLPDPLVEPDGTHIRTAAQWESAGRPAILDAFTRNVYGRSPAPPQGIHFQLLQQNNSALSGRADELRYRIVIPIPAGRSFGFDLAVFVPHAQHPVPAFLLLNNRGVAEADPDRKTITEFWPVETLIDRGFATAVVHLPDIQPDEPDGLTRGIIGALPATGDPNERWATIAAWSWGASRALDCLQTIPTLDRARVAVIGHSRGGKAALWAAAQDTRFGMAVSNDSGCGGAALSRRRFGETVARINETFPHWFCGNFKQFNHAENRLPVDQHELLALIAPRPLCVASADEDLWADPRGTFDSLANASTVYALYGNPLIQPDEMPPLNQPLTRGVLNYHIRNGPHDLRMSDWKVYLQFAARLWDHGPSAVPAPPQTPAS